MRRFAYTLAVFTLVTASQIGQAAEAGKADEQIAQAIVATLRQHQDAGKLKGFDIDLNVEDGRVTLTGNVVDQSQHQLAIDAARFAPGVKVVVNDLKIEGAEHAHPEQQSPREANALLTGLRNAWSKPAEQTPAAKPAHTAGGEKIGAIANPDPLTEDKHIARGYSAFSQLAANKPVATINEVRGAAQPSTREPVASAIAESIVAGPVAKPDRAQQAAWEPRQLDTGDHQPTAVTQAVANGNQQAVQPASDTVAQPPQLPAQQQPQQQPQPQQQQQQQPQQQQIVQYVPVPVYPNMYQQPMPQQMQQRGPVAYASSNLPGSEMHQAQRAQQAQQAQQVQHIRMAQAMQAQAMQAQALQPSQVAPAPQFIQGTGSGGAPARYDHPNMPGYAWPSYASYPNYAALQYPKQYSAHAWPYIGPFYPYPQVPLGWRKVTLSWDDGWWNLDFKDRGYGPYVTR